MVKEKFIKNYNLANRSENGDLMYHRQLVYFNQSISSSKQLQEADKFSLYACFITASVKGLVRGEVQTVGLKYTIKERKLPKQKETVFRLLTGAEFGMTQTFDNINAKRSIIVQFKSGNQISFGIDTDERFYLGGAFVIFNIKR
jgi:hypothetical protein